MDGGFACAAGGLTPFAGGTCSAFGSPTDGLSSGIGGNKALDHECSKLCIRPCLDYPS